MGVKRVKAAVLRYRAAPCRLACIHEALGRLPGDGLARNLIQRAVDLLLVGKVADGASLATGITAAGEQRCRGRPRC